MKSFKFYYLFLFFLININNTTFAQILEYKDTIYFTNGSFKVIDKTYFETVKNSCPLNFQKQIIINNYLDCCDTLLSQYDTIIEKFQVTNIEKLLFSYKRTKNNLKKIDSYILTLHQIYPMRKTFKLIVFCDSNDSISNYKIGEYYNLKIKSLFSCDFSNCGTNYIDDFVYKRYLICEIDMMYMNLYVKL